jgi:hypothetical protein
MDILQYVIVGAILAWAAYTAYKSLFGSKGCGCGHDCPTSKAAPADLGCPTGCGCSGTPGGQPPGPGCGCNGKQ